MYFDALPAEILTQIFLSLPTVSSATALSATCHRLHDTFHSSKRLLILSDAAEQEYGPVNDIIQLVTHNTAQPAHIRRWDKVPVSDALLHQIVKMGRVAQKWEEIYPLRKWKNNYAERRMLSTGERYLLRRALYRVWLFSRAFHTRDHVRTSRSLPLVMRERAALLHNFSTAELAEMLDMHNIFRDVVANNVCPSNGKIRAKFRKRYPDVNANHVMFNIHLNYPPPLPASSFVPSLSDYSHGSAFSLDSKYHSMHLQPGAEGWGDEILHYYVVEDMMKLDPEQILFLRDHCPLKHQVEGYVNGLGEWFGNNGQTFGETLAFVVSQRGGVGVEELREAVEDGEVGVVVAWDD